MLGSNLLACARVSRKKGGLGHTGNCRNDGTARSPLKCQSLPVDLPSGLNVRNKMEMDLTRSKGTSFSCQIKVFLALEGPAP